MTMRSFKVWALVLLYLGSPTVLLAPSAVGQTSSSEAAPSAQFAPAKVVTPNGDSLHGTVRWKKGGPTPKMVHYRSEPDGPVTRYALSEVQEVYFEDGRRLASRVAKVDQVPTSPEAATKYLRGSQPKLQSEHRLLEVVVDGELTLYAVEGRRNRYFIDRDGNVTELLKRRRLDKSKNMIWTNHQYRTQLQHQMAGCPEIMTEAADVDFRIEQLKDLVIAFNECAGGGNTFVRSRNPRTDLSFGLMGGVLRSQFALSNPDYPYSAFGWGGGWTLGMGLTIRFLRTNGHWATRLEFATLTQQIDANPQRYYLGHLLSDTHFIDMRWVKLSVLPRYYIMTSRWSPYVEGGLTMEYLTSINSEMPFYGVQGYSDLDTYATEEGRVALGIQVGLGIQYRAVHLGVRTHGTTGWGTYNNFKSRVINVSLVGGFDF